ncbi:MAG TPA: carbon-nitrogen hydrolase family protein [Firmicutes bacterium]|nr:carbon-nitrogen hydrolase family protein [Candidatus Fermentithermobacillaceae bacterium]
MRLTVALVQHRAYDVDHSQEGLANTLALVDQAARSKPDLIVLPECSYPGYYLGLGGDPRQNVLGWRDALSRFRMIAQRHGVYICVGLAEAQGDKLYNSAFLIDRNGTLVGTARKTFLWHFDRRWFSRGDEFRVFQTDIGNIGMIVCADGRLPEISRVLALKGAEIIIDPTNWVTSGRDAGSLRNPQVDCMIPARAVENGVWYFCANKVGRETDTVVYCGQSIGVSPTGEIVVKGSPDREEIILIEADVRREHRTQAMNLRKECFHESFSLLDRPNEDVPLAKVLRDPVVPGKETGMVGVVQLDRDISLKEYLESGSYLAERLCEQGASLVILPDSACAAVRDSLSLIRNAFAPIARRFNAYIALTAGRNQAALVLGPLDFGERAFTLSSDLLEVGALRVGFMRGKEGLVPEVARSLFLRGADVIAWLGDLGTGHERSIALTRAMENRVYVAFANCSSRDERNSLIASPDGRILAETFPGTKQGILAQASAAVSRVKQVVWGTDVYRDRLPELYKEISSAEVLI